MHLLLLAPSNCTDKVGKFPCSAYTVLIIVVKHSQVTGGRTDYTRAQYNMASSISVNEAVEYLH